MKFFFPCLLFITTFFSLVLVFPGLRIEAPPSSTVQDKCIYTIFKAENQEIQFPFLCTKPSRDKHKLLSFKGWQFLGRFIDNPFHNSQMERTDLSANCAQQLNQAGRFISQPCQLDKIFGPIYRPTATKGLKYSLQDVHCTSRLTWSLKAVIYQFCLRL